MIIELEPVDYYCRRCDSVMDQTGCEAPRCLGYRCLGCGYGCDLHDDPEDGDCAIALASMPHALTRDTYFRARGRLRPIRTVHLPGEECS